MSTLDNQLKEWSKDFAGILFSGNKIKPHDRIPFGIKSLDDITGGIPRGGITEIFGNESNGKTSLCLRAISQAQNMGLRCAFIDSEMAFTEELAIINGVKTDELLVARPLTGEDALELILKFVEGGINLVVLDSVSSMAPESELEADFDQQTMGLQARMMSKGVRKLLGAIEQNNTAVVFTNQLRADINKMGYGDKNITSGGKALRFYALLRIELARVAWKEQGTKPNVKKVGMDIKALTKKNKLGAPMRTVNLEYYFETGFDIDADTLSFLIANGTLKMVGRTYWHGEKEIGNKEKTLEYLKNV